MRGFSCPSAEVCVSLSPTSLAPGIRLGRSYSDIKTHKQTRREMLCAHDTSCRNDVHKVVQGQTQKCILGTEHKHLHIHTNVYIHHTHAWWVLHSEQLLHKISIKKIVSAQRCCYYFFIVCSESLLKFCKRSKTYLATLVGEYIQSLFTHL